MSPSAELVEPAQPARYRKSVPAFFLVLIASSFLGAFLYKARVEGIFACPASGYGSTAYLADCTARTYGDYDHGAFWFDLEPEARRAAAEAEILLIGNSRLQFALGGKSARDWFAALNVRHYLLGFSHSETVRFLGPLLSKIRPRATVYVINVDRFFDDRVSPPAEQILHDRDALARYKEKRAWQALHERLCGAFRPACGNALAVYRTRDTGAWLRLGTAGFEAKLVSDGRPRNVERWDHFAALGEAFLAQLPVDRRCTILTIVPTAETKRAEAKAIAARLGHELLSPRIDDLQTFDGSHLEEASAERWASAFLAEAGPRIRSCVAAARASAG